MLASTELFRTTLHQLSLAKTALEVYQVLHQVLTSTILFGIIPSTYQVLLDQCIEGSVSSYCYCRSCASAWRWRSLEHEGNKAVETYKVA